jgi:hypothetical protein
MFLSGGGRQPLSASPVLFLAAYGQLWMHNAQNGIAFKM